MKIVIIGGGTAGSELAWRLRQQDKELEISILEKSSHTQYSPCSLPYLVSGEIENADSIFLFDSNYYSYNNINLILGAEAKNIDRQKKQVSYLAEGKMKSLGYDVLVLASGGRSILPSIPGLETSEFFTLRNFDDAQKISRTVSSGESALIIGGGYIGIELADALNKKGLKVLVAEAGERLMSGFFDKEISEKIKTYISESGVEVLCGSGIEKIKGKKAYVNNKEISFDHLFVCCGLSVSSGLAQEAGLVSGEGIKTDVYGQTLDENIYALGDLVKSDSPLGGEKISSCLATSAVRQARNIAMTILGKKTAHEPALNTCVSRFGGLVFGASGVSEAYCRERGIATVSAFYSAKTKAEYYPGNKDISVKIISLEDGRIVGCQIAGFEDVVGRINMAALAIRKQMTLEEFVGSETCYNPAVAPIFDPVIIAAEICLKKLKAKNEQA